MRLAGRDWTIGSLRRAFGILNVHKPRDRSHFERFESYHQSFYRSVEATSVTPFAPRAIDRALAGVVVALAGVLMIAAGEEPSYGVVTGELTLERWVETCCTTPARMFGMYGQKGVIQPGADGYYRFRMPDEHVQKAIGMARQVDGIADCGWREGGRTSGACVRASIEQPASTRAGRRAPPRGTRRRDAGTGAGAGECSG